MTFEKNKFYLYQGKVYQYQGKTSFASGYTLYYFENTDTFELLTLGQDEISDVKEY